MKYLYCLLILFTTLNLSSQDDFEFEKGFYTFLKINSGLVIQEQTDAFAGGLSVIPSYSIIDRKLRLGAEAGFVITDKKFQGVFGIGSSFKLTSINVDELLGLTGNMNLNIRHRWLTESQKTYGLGLQFEFFNLLGLSFHWDRDYVNEQSWLTVGVSYELKTPPMESENHN